MSSNINYSITDQDGSIVIRSTAKSFNLDHVTDKDIVSFYRNFSSYAMFDTGLMPLSGTGVLAIRNAGNHTQITFQHQPQINHINWGANEGDPNAKTYTVAQPYRIWIGDLVNGDLYGARMFYSPYPITSPDQQLYHLNLPNTNCKGYRGNGVGWQCLYHKDSWQELPFNEKIVRFAERCSGVETYNDANMSETDGPRFYKENDMPQYLWDPIAWENKTSEQGLDWALSVHNWIPILVKDQDNQGSHDENGIPLTIQMAMLGDYQAYYTDNYRPKSINSLSRSDLNFDSNNITLWIARSHHASLLADKAYNPMEASKEIRMDFNTNIQPGGFDIDDEDEQEEDTMMSIACPITGKVCHVDQDDHMVDTNGNAYCEPCFSENVAFCENTDEYIPINDPKVKWIDSQGIYVNTDHAEVEDCDNCGTIHIVENNSKFLYTSSTGIQVCKECISSYATKNFNPSTESLPDGSTVGNCVGCSATVLIGDNWSHIFPTPKTISLNFNSEGSEPEIVVDKQTYCCNCSTQFSMCPTGHFTLYWANPIQELPKPFNVKVINPDQMIDINTSVTHLCIDCTNEDLRNLDSDPNSEEYKIALNNITNPFNSAMLTEERFNKSVIEGIAFSGSGVMNLTFPESPF